MNLNGLKIVELDRTIPIVEDDEAVKALVHHPGFLIILQRLKNQKAVLKSLLETTPLKEVRDADVLQIGLKWLSYLQNELDKSVAKKPTTVEVAPSHDQLEDFHKVLALLESV